MEVLQVVIGFVFFAGSYIESTMNYCHSNLANALYFHNMQSQEQSPSKNGLAVQGIKPDVLKKATKNKQGTHIQRMSEIISVAGSRVHSLRK